MLFAARARIEVLADKLDDEHSPPKGARRNGAHDTLLEALERLDLACKPLSAPRTASAPLLSSTTRSCAEADKLWVTSLQAIYKVSGLTPPLPS